MLTLNNNTTVCRPAPSYSLKEAIAPQSDSLNARLLDDYCRSGKHQINVNHLDADKLVELMDYWWNNAGM